MGVMTMSSMLNFSQFGGVGAVVGLGLLGAGVAATVAAVQKVQKQDTFPKSITLLKVTLKSTQVFKLVHTPNWESFPCFCNPFYPKWSPKLPKLIPTVLGKRKVSGCY